MHVLLISTYELGHQPVSLAGPVARLTSAGHEVRCLDLTVEAYDETVVDWADRVALSVPMHTAMRLALEVAASIRSRRPGVPLCFYGLYASVSRDLTLRFPGDAVVAGEYEAGLLAWADGREPGAAVQLGRVVPAIPDRRPLPALQRYARLVDARGERLAGAVEASRGCSHRCRHCPVPVVYEGRVRPGDQGALVADVDQLVDAGAQHVTFSDPDFLNAPHHSRRVVAAVHSRHPDLTFDCTVKVEHVLRHRDLWPELAEAGCIFVVSAFESVSDAVLDVLDKGHTSVEASEAVQLLRESGIEVRPSWLPFTPWSTAADLVALFDFVVAHDLVANVDPVQFSVRLLVPEGSLLLGRPELVPHLGFYDADRLGWTWTHPDPAIDDLQAQVARLVEERIDDPPEEVFGALWALVRDAAGVRAPGPELGERSRGPSGPRPRLTETWFCCSEPTSAQLAPLARMATAPG